LPADLRLVDGHAEHDAIDRGRHRGEIDLEVALARLRGEADRAVGPARLVVEDHVLIAAHLAGRGQQVGGRVRIDGAAGCRRPPEAHRHACARDSGVRALKKLGHAAGRPFFAGPRRGSIHIVIPRLFRAKARVQAAPGAIGGGSERELRWRQTAPFRMRLRSEMGDDHSPQHHQAL
jgi:hypothetical protein